MVSTEYKNKLDKALDFLKLELTQVRTGRASPSLLEEVEVEAYGSTMKVKELGSISLLDAQNLLVLPWDKSLLKSISKAIRESDLKLNPIDDSDKIRVPVPALTEERRKELAKLVSQKVEDSKNVARNIRQDIMKDIDKQFADKEIGEDEKFRFKEDTEKVIKEYVTKIDELGEDKKADLLKI
jgi:ribosome recycling factor